MPLLSYKIILPAVVAMVLSLPLSAKANDFAKDRLESNATPTTDASNDANDAKVDQYNADQAQAINKIPGENVSAADLQQAKKKHLDLNPVDWVFAPVIKMEKQSVILQQDIMKLVGPIASLQPGMLGLEKRINSVQDQMGTVDGKLGHVQQQMTGLQSDVKAMRNELSQIRRPVSELKQPILDIKDPITKMSKHLAGLDQELRDLKILLGFILTSIFVAAAVIAMGTPLAAILIWRNRAKLLPAPKPHEAAAEESIDRAGRTMTQQLKRKAG